MLDNNLREAVRRLRLDLGKTQTEFGVLIGKGLATIQRYETLVAPKGKVLLRLEKLARENRLDECAKTFRDALLAELGLDQQNTDLRPLPFPRTGGVIVASPDTPVHLNRIAAIGQLERETQWPGDSGERARKEMKLVDRGLERVLGDLLIGGRAPTEQDRAAAIVRLHRDGIQPGKIAKKLNVPIAVVDAIVSAYGDKRQ